MATVAKPTLVDIALKQNYKHEVYLEQRGIKGFISWWSEIERTTTPLGRDLVINTPNKFDRIILNGIEIPQPSHK